MRRIATILLASAVLAFGSSVSAASVWNGPGWYVVAQQLALILWSGPYADRDACQRALPQDNDPPGFSYSCVWFDQEPESEKS